VSDRALDYAIALARRYDARIYLAHVITPDPFQLAEVQLAQATYEKVRQAAEEDDRLQRCDKGRLPGPHGSRLVGESAVRQTAPWTQSITQ
jgi:nucleotide-binding universal stress UspA family protein